MTEVIRRIWRSDMVRHGALVLTAMTMGNIAAFGYHAVVSRHLGVAEYGALYALISFVALVTLPVGFIPTVVARYAAEFCSVGDDRHARALAEFVARAFGMVCLAFFVFLSALSVPIARFLHVSPWFIPPTAFVAAAAFFSPMLRSVLQGQGDFLGFSWASASEGFAKFICGAAAAIAGFGVAGALLGFAMGAVVSSSLSGFRLWIRLKTVEPLEFKIDWRRVLQTSGGAAATTIAIAVLSSADVILVKHFFLPSEAGLYAAASLGGKIMLFGVGFAPTILLTKATQRHARGEGARGALLGAGAMLSAVSACGLIFFWLGGPLILRSLVGPAFLNAGPLLVWYAFAMTLLAATNLLTSYALALHRFTFAVPLLCVALLEPLGIILIHKSLNAVIGVIVVVNFAACIATGAALFVDSVKARQQRSRNHDESATIA